MMKWRTMVHVIRCRNIMKRKGEMLETKANRGKSVKMTRERKRKEDVTTRCEKARRQ